MWDLSECLLAVWPRPVHSGQHEKHVKFLFSDPQKGEMCEGGECTVCVVLKQFRQPIKIYLLLENRQSVYVSDIRGWYQYLVFNKSTNDTTVTHFMVGDINFHAFLCWGDQDTFLVLCCWKPRFFRFSDFVFTKQWVKHIMLMFNNSEYYCILQTGTVWWHSHICKKLQCPLGGSTSGAPQFYSTYPKSPTIVLSDPCWVTLTQVSQPSPLHNTLSVVLRLPFCTVNYESL